MKKLLLLLAFAMMLQNVSAQLKTYLTFEAGPQWSLIKVADPNGVFKNASVRSSVAGFTLGQEIFTQPLHSDGCLLHPQQERD